MTKQTKPQARRSKRQEQGLTIEVNWQHDGGVYGLDPWSEDKIQEAFPDAPVIVDGMAIGYNETRDYERYHKPYFEQIAQMVTGLTPQQIAQLGGVRILDQEANKVLWEWHPRGPNGE